MTRKLLGPLEALFFVLAVLAVLASRWFEALTGLDPDLGSGTLEAAVAVTLVALGLLCHWLRASRPARA